MKKSRYNIFIEISPGETMVFNGITKKFFYLSSEHIPQLNAIFDSSNNYLHRSEYKNFICILKDNGFLVEDAVDEFSQLRMLFESYKATKLYSLLILTTYSCNFSCWYCVQKHKSKFLNEENIEKIKKHITKYILDNNLKAFQISWFGGEPLLNFNAIRKIGNYAQQFCSKNGIAYSCGITTNGSLITPNMASEMKDLGFKYFQITIDGKKENHNRTRFNSSIKDSFTTILNNIKILINTIPDVEVTIRFNYTHNNLDEAIVDELDSVLYSCKDKIELLFRKVWQEPHTTELSKKVGIIMKMFLTKGYNILHDYDNIKLTSCYVEQTHYNAIFPDGTVDKCSNKDIAETRGFLTEKGNINWTKTPDEIDTNVFNYPSECSECKYLPLCMGPCPRNRPALIIDNKIRCQYKDKNKLFEDEIKNFALINTTI